MNLPVDEAVHVTTDPAIDADQAAVALHQPAPADAEAGFADDNVPCQQDLGQHAHDQEDGNGGAAADEHADAGDNLVGGQKPMAMPARAIIAPEVMMVGKARFRLSVMASFRGIFFFRSIYRLEMTMA